MRHLLWVLAAATLLTLPAARHAAAWQAQSLGNWRIEQESAADGSAYCDMHARYASGIYVSLVRSARTPDVLFLFKQGWSVPQGTRSAVEITIDRLYRGQLVAEGAGSGVAIVLPPDAVRAFRAGRRMQVVARGDTFAFSLDGTRRAHDALQSCAHAMADANPFGGDHDLRTDMPPEPRTRRENGPPEPKRLAAAGATLVPVSDEDSEALAAWLRRAGVKGEALARLEDGGELWTMEGPTLAVYRVGKPGAQTDLALLQRLAGAFYNGFCKAHTIVEAVENGAYALILGTGRRCTEDTLTYDLVHINLLDRRAGRVRNLILPATNPAARRRVLEVIWPQLSRALLGPAA